MDESQGLTGIDRALADALDVDVSPEFAARVRRRIATGPAPSRVRWAWQLAAAAVAALVIGGAAIATLSTPRPAAPAPQSARSLPAESPAPAMVNPAPPRAAATRPQAVAARVPLPAAATAPLSASAVEVLVPRAEIDMYRRLFAAARTLPPAIVANVEQATVVEPAVSEITIDPIRIDLIAPSSGAQGDRR